jgi:hypothetical protein
MIQQFSEIVYAPEIQEGGATTEVPWEAEQADGWQSTVPAAVRAGVWAALILALIAGLWFWSRRSRADEPLH